MSPVAPVTSSVVTSEAGELPTKSYHVTPLVPASHSRKYEVIAEPPSCVLSSGVQSTTILVVLV